MHDDNERVLMQLRGVPARTMTKLEAMMDPTNPNVFEANDNEKRISELEEENRRMREALGQSLRQWKMYAELEEERDLEAEVTPEADLYRIARAALSQEV